jgi:hypothetical protein
MWEKILEHMFYAWDFENKCKSARQTRFQPLKFVLPSCGTGTWFFPLLKGLL